MRSPTVRYAYLGAAFGICVAAALAGAISAAGPWTQTQWAASAPGWALASLVPAIGLIWLAWMRLYRTGSTVAKVTVPVWGVVWIIGTTVVLLARPTPVFAIGQSPGGTGIGPGWTWAAVAVILGVPALVCLAVVRQAAGTHRQRWVKLVTIAVPPAITVAALFGGSVAGGTYQLHANDRTSTGEGRAGDVTASSLSGGQRWSVPMVAFPGRVSASSAGLATTVGTAVVMLDPATGAEVWRYERVAQRYAPAIVLNQDGTRLIATYLNHSPIELDVTTGKVVRVWPAKLRDQDVELDPPVTVHEVGRGSDSLIALKTDGSGLWTKKPGRGVRISMQPVGDFVIASYQGSYQKGPERMVGYDYRSGKERWSLPGGWALFGSTGDLAVAKSTRSHELIGIEPATGTVRWRTALCETPTVQATVAMTVCGDSRRDVTTYDLRSGKKIRSVTLPNWFSSPAPTSDGRIVGISTRDKRCGVVVAGADGIRQLAEPVWSQGSSMASCGKAVTAGSMVLVTAPAADDTDPDRRISLIALR